jgi:chorismate mutase
VKLRRYRSAAQLDIWPFGVLRKCRPIRSEYVLADASHRSGSDAGKGVLTLMDNIDDLRERMDAIDDELLRLFNERAKLALEIGRVKKDLGLPIYVPSREEQIITRIQQENPGPLSPTSISRLYQQLIQESRTLEEEDADSHARADQPDLTP